MAKLTRVNQRVFGGSAASDEIGQFGSAIAGAKLETGDVGTIQALSAWLAGWSEATLSGNRYPTLQERNGVDKVLSYQAAYILQEGIAEYSADATYHTGSIVKKVGAFELYGSITDNNVGNALTVGTEWQFLTNLANIISKDQIGTCSTASATAEKAVVCEGFELVDGVTIMTTFDNSNTASGDYLQVSFNGNANDDFGLYTPTVIGSPTFTNNKFNSNGNTGLSYLISTLGSGTWCIQGKFKSTNTSTTQVFIANGTSADACLQLIKNTSNKLGLYLSSNGSSNDIADVLGTKSDWGVGTEYYIRLRFTGTQYLVDWSVDETSWTNDIAVSSTSPIYTRTYGLYFGIWANVVSPLIGTMDDLRVSVGSATITDTRLKINANSTGAVSLVGIDGKKTSYLPANTKIPLFYDGTNFVSLLTNTKSIMPDYSNPVSKAWNTLYQAECDGWVRMEAQVNDASQAQVYIGFTSALEVSQMARLYLNGVNGGDFVAIFPIQKGMYYKGVDGGTNKNLKFYPSKGAK